ncbi:MAG: alpha-L-fucosidase [Verrucomicrobiota bacterium]
MKNVLPLKSFFCFLFLISILSAATPSSFEPTDESLRKYECPEWFRDAKLGFWSHWGPQAVPRQGDWYAKRLYIQNDIDKKTGENRGPHPDYLDHLKHYGHPSIFGYKDIIPLWKAEKWNPDELMALYKKVGARYFFSMGSHHDNFFLWNSKIHRWNAVQMGPHKDVLGLWQAAARKQGLPFGVSEHLAASYTWFQSSHGADTTGPKKGVPYDGNDSQYQDLYHTKADANDRDWLTKNIEWHQEWLKDITELIDLYHPDLLYSDSELPFGDYGRKMLAHYYNEDLKKNGGKLQAVYNAKHDNDQGRYVKDIERGVSSEIRALPWQTDTSIGDWFYRTDQKYLTAEQVVQMLVDIVSKNGNLLINIVQTPEGNLEQDVLEILNQIGQWTSTNGEGVYATRPWKIYGEGPSTSGKVEKGRFGGNKDVPSKAYEGNDFRFTSSKDGKIIYAFCLGKPDGLLCITSLKKSSPHLMNPIQSVEVLGSSEKVEWHQDEKGLLIHRPSSIPGNMVLGFKIKN